jgi:hypothetical protein
MTKYWLGKKRGPMPQEWKDKISAKLKVAANSRPEGNKNNLLGTYRIVSAEGKLRMSLGQKGKKFSPEHIEKLRIKSTGRYYSPETRPTSGDPSCRLLHRDKGNCTRRAGS